MNTRQTINNPHNMGQVRKALKDNKHYNKIKDPLIDSRQLYIGVYHREHDPKNNTVNYWYSLTVQDNKNSQFVNITFDLYKLYLDMISNTITWNGKDFNELFTVYNPAYYDNVPFRNNLLEIDTILAYQIPDLFSLLYSIDQYIKILFDININKIDLSVPLLSDDQANYKRYQEYY